MSNVFKYDRFRGRFDTACPLLSEADCNLMKIKIKLNLERHNIIANGFGQLQTGG